uniref:Isopropylmalate dehydrogenase-like domain-containing protein n=1 Tax=Chenopodium quinoa TaxID=63459 RepID=A0A803MDV2_CHEQI
MSGVSLQCGDCGALLKSVEEDQQHAELTSHSNFSKSTKLVLNLVCSSCGKPCRSKIGFRFLELSFSSSFAAMGRIEQVMDAMHAPIVFDKYEVHGDMKKIPEGVLESIRENKVCIKGGLMTPVGGGVSSLNVHLRKELDLYASLVHCFNVKGIQTRHDNVDIVVIRENSGGEYAGLEHEIVHGVVESLKFVDSMLLITRSILF